MTRCSDGQAPTVSSLLQDATACCSMPQHLLLRPVGGGFEACHTACHSMPQHTENWVGTLLAKNIGPKYQSHPTAVICQRWTVLQKLDGASVIEMTLVRFLGVAICKNPGRSLFSSLCLLMSTVQPTEEGTTEPNRNKETTRSTTDCLQWAIGEGIRQYLCFTNTQEGEGQHGKLYGTVRALWLSSRGASLKDHVLGENKKQPDGSYACQPEVRVRF